MAALIQGTVPCTLLISLLAFWMPVLMYLLKLLERESYIPVQKRDHFYPFAEAMCIFYAFCGVSFHTGVSMETDPLITPQVSGSSKQTYTGTIATDVRLKYVRLKGNLSENEQHLSLSLKGMCTSCYHSLQTCLPF